MNSFFPLEKQNRLTVVDALRGLALFCILLANIPFQEKVVAYTSKDIVLGSPGIDKILDFAFHLLIDKKFVAIFSILFGFGFYIQIKRAEEKGIAFRSYFVKRMIPPVADRMCACIFFLVRRYYPGLCYLWNISITGI